MIVISHFHYRTYLKKPPDPSLIKQFKPSKNNFEDYIDNIFQTNPHLSEEEMFTIYHNHKPVFEEVLHNNLRIAKLNKLSSELNVLSDKLRGPNGNEFWDKLFPKYVNKLKASHKLYDKK